MSSGPLLPADAGATLKSFWSKREGKVALVFLGILGIATAFNAVAIMNYILTLTTDLLHLSILAAELLVVCWVLFSKRSHWMFRVIMRKFTGIFISVYPIEILRDHILQMKKRKAQFDQQIANVAGQMRILKDRISANTKDGIKSLKEAEFAKQQALKGHDGDAETLRMNLQMRSSAAHAGRLKEANVGYQGLLDKTQKVYDLLSKWSIHIDYLIEDTTDTADQAEVQYKTVNAAYGALDKAKKLIVGDTDENDTYDQTMQFLADDAGRKLGEIDDFERVATGFVDKMDVETGAVQQDALDALEVYEQKVLTPGNKDTAFLLPGATAQPQPVPIDRQAPAATGTDGGDYSDLLK
jgi:hypothetical protein